MFEAKLREGVILKKIVESIKDLVTEANIDISPSGNFRIILYFKYTLLILIKQILILIMCFRYLIASYGQFTCCLGLLELDLRWI
jgi:hypothetical protein